MTETDAVPSGMMAAAPAVPLAYRFNPRLQPWLGERQGVTADVFVNGRDDDR